MDTGKNSAIQNPQVKSYATAMATKVRPKKEQGVIIDSIEGCSNDDYIDAIEKLIDLSYIRYISKISRARVCVFVSSGEIVEKLKSFKQEATY